ncbi:tetratricopeptide repeat protein [Candidatus Fermentibacteria bacterium]|nr:tetratricopeptide repeat protein [Candidatus Fermentibacteria bacterium]
MRYRSLALSIIAAACALGGAGASQTLRQPADHSETIALRSALNAALQHDDMERAAWAMKGLLERGVDPTNVALSAQSRLSPRSAEALPPALVSVDAPHLGEVLLLLASGRRDWARVDSLTALLDIRDLRVSSLQALGMQAEEAGHDPAVVWAYGLLRAHGGSWTELTVIHLAEAMARCGAESEAAALLDSLLASGSPGTLRHQAAVARARLMAGEGKDDDALDLLGQIPRGRPERGEAELLAAMIRFSREGTDSLARALEAAARLRPGMAEANDAYDVAQLASHLPQEPKVRQRALESLRHELRGRFASAAQGYSEVRRATDGDARIRWGIREARCLERAGRLDEALEAWGRLDPAGEEGPVVLLGAGDCLTAAGMPDSARILYMEVLERFPASPHAARARSRLLQ